MNVQKKLLVMLSGALGILILLIFTLSFFSKEKYNAVKKEELKEKEYVVDIALSHASSNLINTAYDNTLWDALADYIKKPSQEWVNDNINTLIQTSDMQYIWIYNTMNEQIYSIQNPNAVKLETPFIDINKYFDINQKKEYHFYVNQNNTIIEVAGFSVHGSNDVDRSGKPNGYMFVGRVINDKIVNDLKTLTNTSVYLYKDNSQKYQLGEYQNVIYRKLYRWDNSEIAKFVFVSEDKLAKTEASYNKLNLVIYFIFIILLITFMFFIIKKNISDPLRKIKECFDTKDVESINELSHNKNEFGQIAKLMITAFTQNAKIEEQYQKIQSQNSELEDLNATKDKFFSIIAHDLRNPFAVILSTTEFISNPNYVFTKEELVDFSKDINFTAKNLFNLLENLLTWARSQRGTVPYEPEVFSVYEVLETTVFVQTSQAEAKNIKIETETEKSLSCFADKNMVLTVLRNLVSNAIKFTPIGGVIKLKVNDLKDGYLEFNVIDNGVGIPPENINKLFRIDVSVSTLGTTAEKGTGLGLILCKEFVEKNGGKIHVESEINKGSTFIFTIPKEKK